MDVNQSPAPVRIDINGVPVIVTPPSWQHHILDNLGEKEFIQIPGAINESIVVRDNGSFVYYAKRFATPDALYVVNRITQQVNARLDYHKNAETPALAQHLLVRQFAFSKRFDAWKTCDKKPFTQVDFANFLEDRLKDLSRSANAETSQSEIHTAVSQFRATQSSQCTSALNQANGDVEFQFTTATQVVSMSLPTRLLLSLEIYEFGQVWELGARLKYRLKEGVITFWYELINVSEFIADVFEAEVEQLRGALGPAPGGAETGGHVFILEQ
jgi:uncharacterized protein YfdQ (DUF2303 family)